MYTSDLNRSDQFRLQKWSDTIYIYIFSNSRFLWVFILRTVQCAFFWGFWCFLIYWRNVTFLAWSHIQLRRPHFSSTFLLFVSHVFGIQFQIFRIIYEFGSGMTKTKCRTNTKLYKQQLNIECKRGNISGKLIICILFSPSFKENPNLCLASVVVSNC